MKKLILFAAILFAGVSVVKADGTITSTTAKTGAATLNVILDPFHSIVVNSTAAEIRYTSMEDYENGKSSIEQVNHLTVSSTGAFTITASAPDLMSDTESMAANSITIAASNAGANAYTGTEATLKDVTLQNAGVTLESLVDAKTGGRNKTFNVIYTGSSLGAYLDKNGVPYLSNNSTTTYTTQVTYTLLPK